MMALSNPSFFACACTAVTKSGSCSAIWNYSGTDFVSIKSRFAREFLPLAQADLAEFVLIPDLHRELDLLKINLIVGKNAGDVVVAVEASHIGAFGQKQRVVFGVRIGAGNEPVEAEGVDKGINVGFAIRRVSAQ